MDTKKQIYFLGQIYAALCDAMKISDPNAFERAARIPMREITPLLIKFKSNLKPVKDVKTLDVYLTLRMDMIDSDNELIFGGQVLPVELQGTFIIGYNQYDSRKDVKKLIAHTGLTQEQVAEKLGVASNTVSRWCTGESKVSEENRFKIEQIIMDSWE